MRPALVAAALALALCGAARAAEFPIPVVAAENFYGEVAAAIGGDRVAVESIIVAPGVDPHDFEPTPSTARSIAEAKLVILNGAGYDHWMERLLDGSAAGDRSVISVADLVGAHEGDNPHVWYDPRAVPALAKALTETLSAIDPDGAAGYASREKTFVASLEPMLEKIAAIRKRYAGQPVTASEPVFGLMAEALGLDMKHQDFQTAIMNETEPTARNIAAIDGDLAAGKVKAFFYNSQVVDPLTEQLLASAKAGGVPVVGVTETKPGDRTYVEWMTDELDATLKALAGPSS